jgi:hypothetical protein
VQVVNYIGDATMYVVYYGNNGQQGAPLACGSDPASAKQNAVRMYNAEVHEQGSELTVETYAQLVQVYAATDWYMLVVKVS